MNTHTPISLDAQPVLAWEAPARPIVERTRNWYIAAGVVVTLAAIYGIFSGSWSFAVVAVLAGGMYLLIHDHRPPVFKAELHESGIQLEGAFTRWEELAGFWMLETPEYHELHFVPKARRMDLVIQTGTLDVAKLRMILVQRIPELPHKKETILDILVRLCKL